MKVSTAWARVASENSVLKFVVLCLTGLTLFLGFSALKLALKEPLVIDRGCFSKKATALTDGKRTQSEIEAFLKEALTQRFDSAASVRNGFISSEESGLREKEQKELDARKLSQRLVLNQVVANGNVLTIDADRLISVGDIRSAFKFPLAVKVESIARSEGNPYGLILVEAKAIEKNEKQ